MRRTSPRNETLNLRGEEQKLDSVVTEGLYYDCKYFSVYICVKGVNISLCTLYICLAAVIVEGLSSGIRDNGEQSR